MSALPDEWRRYFRRTLYVMIFVGVAAIAFDVWLSTREEAPAWLISISGVWRYVGSVVPFVAFGTAGLAGHFHVNLGAVLREFGVATGWNGQLFAKPWNYIALGILSALYVGAGLYWLLVLGSPMTATVVMGSTWLGYWAGALLWPQRGPQMDPRLAK